ncbi:unnamed protein product [Brassica napus]|uniref:Uncharacterized protein n=2 Tax=Brassica TaxID=3705 RepID=A0A3P6E1T3_BRAOL|nr:unnamed protein product [Brassica napus]VDD37987.1 unnamed protein product [Brassica oleracea]
MTFTRWSEQQRRKQKEIISICFRFCYVCCCLTEAAKPDEEAVNERNENFVSLADVLDAEHDPQLTMLPMMECGEEKEEGWGVWDGTVRFFIVNGQHGSCFGK